MSDPTPPEPLPKTLVRRCCRYKDSCGNTNLYLARVPVETADGGAEIQFAYRRESNDNDYFGPASEDDVRKFLADEDYFPHEL